MPFIIYDYLEDSGFLWLRLDDWRGRSYCPASFCSATAGTARPCSVLDGVSPRLDEGVHTRGSVERRDPRTTRPEPLRETALKPIKRQKTRYYNNPLNHPAYTLSLIHI